MNTRIFFLLLIFVFLNLRAFTQQATSLIPEKGWMPGWDYSYDVTSYQGDDLFFLINGGADLFLEYGFTDVAAVELQHPDDGKMYIEIYRMDSDSAAYGIFSLRKGDAPMNPSGEGWQAVGEDFMHLWQGNYYVSVSGGNLKPDIRADMFTALSAHIREQHPAENQLPAVLAEQPDIDPGSCIYLRGPLGMNNVYSFGPGNLFNIHEALIWNQENLQNFMFFYPSSDTAQEVYQQVLNSMLSSSRFSDFQMREKGFVVTDRHGQTLYGKKEGRTIRLSLSK